MDIAAGEGLVSLVGGAQIQDDGVGYNFLGSRGASKITLHDGSIRFNTSDSATGIAGQEAVGLSGEQTKMILTNVGNVGIGTASPSEKLEVAGHISGTPIMGTWYPSAHLLNQAANTHVIMILDVEQCNTNPKYFTKNSDNQGITVHIAGYYQIEAKALVYVSVGDYGHLYLYRHGGILELDHGHSGTGTNWDDRHVNWIGYLSVGDVINLRVYHHNFTSHGYHGGTPIYTKLNILKLN